MNERVTRLWAGAEAEALGDGGIAIVERATGLSRTTVRAGREERFVPNHTHPSERGYSFRYSCRVQRGLRTLAIVRQHVGRRSRISGMR